MSEGWGGVGRGARRCLERGGWRSPAAKLPDLAVLLGRPRPGLKRWEESASSLEETAPSFGAWDLGRAAWGLRQSWFGELAPTPSTRAGEAGLPSQMKG